MTPLKVTRGVKNNDIIFVSCRFAVYRAFCQTKRSQKRTSSIFTSESQSSSVMEAESDGRYNSRKNLLSKLTLKF